MNNPHPHNCFWTEYADKYGAPDIKYCEETICSVISEPANTWSNFAFIFAGLFIIYLGLKSKSKLANMMGGTAILVGIGSFTYHMSNNFYTQYFDFIGMHCFFGLVLCLNLLRLKVLTESNFNKVYLLSYIPFMFFVAYFRYISIPIQIVMMSIVVGILSTELLIYLKSKVLPNKWFFISLAGFALAATCQAIDVRRIYCDPTDHWIQPHAFWHYFNALGMGLLYKYYSTLSIFNHMRK